MTIGGGYEEKAVQKMAMTEFLRLMTSRPLCGRCHIDELDAGPGNRKQQGWGKARTGGASIKTEWVSRLQCGPVCLEYSISAVSRLNRGSCPAKERLEEF